MKNKEYRKLLKIAVIGLLIAAPLLILPQPAHAIFGIDLSPAGILTAAFSALASIINFVFGMLFILGGLLVNMMMHLNADILNQNNALVGVGWTISRDVANLGFVLVMIIMAVATIVRYEKFSAKSLLPKLIGAAIIVNFSLTIAGVFITFSNSLTNVFLNGKMSGDMVSAIENAFGPQKLLLPPENPPPPNPADQGSALGGFSAAVVTSIAGLIFTTLFTALAAFVMIALAIMLLIRYVMLSFLLIVAPLAWLFWVFPPLNKPFREWWSKFLDWVFFAPAVAFFIYIALTGAQFLGTAHISTGGSVGSVLETTFSQGAQMIVLAGILLGGLIAAKSMGITTAKGTIAIAEKAGKGARKGLANYTKDQGRRAALSAAGSKAGQATLGGASGVLGNLGTRMSGIGANSGWLGRTLTSPFRRMGRRLGPQGAAGRLAKAGAAGQAHKQAKQGPNPPPAPSLFGSIYAGVRGQFGAKQWECQLCQTVVGPSKKPPNKCPNNNCPTNAQVNPAKTQWKPK